MPWRPGVWMSRVETLLRQQRLVLRSAQLRHTMADQAQALKLPLSLADRARGGVDWLRQHPLVPASALALLVLLRPARALRWGGSLWSAWKLYRKLSDWAAMAGLVGSSPRGEHHVRSR